MQIPAAVEQYSVWDQLDDLVFHKVNVSDVYTFQQEYPWFPAQVWGAVWTTISCAGCECSPLSLRKFC